MTDGIHTAQTKQRLGAQQRDAKDAALQPLQRQPAGAGKGRHNEGEPPGHKPRGDAAKGPPAIGLTPEQARQGGRGNLQYGGKGDDTDINQREGFTHAD